MQEVPARRWADEGGDVPAEPRVQRKAPRRHGADLATTRRIARWVRLSTRGACEPDETQWAELGDALWRGDPLADDVVSWLHREGMATARPKLERAIKLGLATVPDAPIELQRFMCAVEQPPAWLDADLMRQGARFIHSTGRFGMMVLRDAGLMAGYQAGAINQTLLMTGALQRGAQRRMAETTAWWMDCTEEGGPLPGSKGYQTTLHVRAMHALVRGSVRKHPQWDADELGLPINQVDMQATYLGFSVVYLLALRATGVIVTMQDAHGVMHLWRYIGWLMGVDDSLLFKDEMAARMGLYHNLISQAPPDASSVALGQALADEPLHRHYPLASKWVGRFNKARHLSIVRLFVGREGMGYLGLPATLPWYPLLTFLPRLMWTSLMRMLPGGRSLLTAWGRSRQQAYLPVLFGAQRPGVAHAAHG
jgi:ER-bound oxygenase mpaB/B'/Rubber oxygenase, catalytic domain